ncbi:metal-dependent hydrolase [Macrococcus hajekii]|uniref:Metal-dependent hydrolase n=1 Tax=Macrococcus hajekii TaxID=198482 RepID=A0A4R6BJB9_9STAP|nr:metal-dependent hydrolase [Macrococcus hajekii]TDM01676.1 metal-dependent hydrolase [Macrococcus hajekii]GGB13291.1 membrane protein [Macrococcus hajekii]
MTGKTHLAFGILVGTGYALKTTSDVGTSAVIIATTALFSLVPDICHAGSKIGRHMKLLSKLISFFFGHRTLTHSFFFMALVAVLLTMLNIDFTYIVCAIIGIASHILLDMLTPRGVALFFPLDFKVTSPINFKTGGIMDLSLATTFSLLTAYLIYVEMFHRTMSWIN